MPGPQPDGFVTTGLPALDAIVGGLRVGDNVVWRVDRLDDYRAFMAPFVAAARRDGRRIVHFRFGSRSRVIDAADVDCVHALDAFEGFEPFAQRVHEIVAREGHGVFHVFDCLSELLDAWATDAMIANFFRVTCPYLFELDTVAWFAIERGAHSFATVDAIRARVIAWRDAGEGVALVPTMGALHAGHLALVAAAKELASRVIVSIFVNPLQFAPTEDFAAYPRDLEGDVAQLGTAGTDAVFSPETTRTPTPWSLYTVAMFGPVTPSWTKCL